MRIGNQQRGSAPLELTSDVTAGKTARVTKNVKATLEPRGRSFVSTRLNQGRVMAGHFNADPPPPYA